MDEPSASRAFSRESSSSPEIQMKDLSPTKPNGGLGTASGTSGTPNGTHPQLNGTSDTTFTTDASPKTSAVLIPPSSPAILEPTVATAKVPLVPFTPSTTSGYAPPPEVVELGYAYDEDDDDDHIDGHSEAPIIRARPRDSNKWLSKAKKIKRRSEPLVGKHDWEKIGEKVSRWLNELIELLWRITEVHINKLVLLIIVIVVSHNMVAAFVPVVVLVTVTVCLPSAIAGILSVILCLYLCLMTVTQMVFRLDGVDTLDNFTIFGHDKNCSTNGTKTFAEWVGIETDRELVFNAVQALLIGIVALVLQSVVVYRQRHHRDARGESHANRFMVFPELNPADFDKSLVNFLKFMVDYGFYKFGLEVSMVMMAIVGWVRMDFLGLVVLGFLIVFALGSRKVCRILWPVFLLYLAIIFPLEYALMVGLPPRECIPYPWDSLFGKNVKSKYFAQWMDLPFYDTQYKPVFFVLDFILFLTTACQLSAFKRESKDHPAGDNDSIYLDSQYVIKPNNPHYDFIAQQRSFVDYIKVAIFHYGHWVSILMVLVAGFGGTSLFALGYICLSFWILWSGNNLYIMKNHKDTIRRWYIVIGYTAVTMYLKVALQLVGCVFLDLLGRHTDDKKGNTYFPLCAVRILFSVTCVNRVIRPVDNQILNLFPEENEFNNKCEVAKNEAMIGFDTIAIAFLVFQMRILHSWFFQHSIVEFRSEIVLANRGAVLKNQLIEKEMKEQNEQQTAKFDEIKKRTAAIRKRYEELAQKGEIHEPQTYGQAKRAGDYYMFDYDPRKDELTKLRETFVPEVDPGASDFDKLDPSQLAYAAVSKDLDMKDTLEQAEIAEQIKDEEKRMALAVRKSKSNVTGEDGTETTKEKTGEEEEEGKLIWALRFVQKVATSAIEWASAFLNRQSREHRYVQYVLAKEKQRLKMSKSESLTDVSRRLADIHNDTKSDRDLFVVHSESDIQKMESEAYVSWQQRSVIARFVNALGSCIAAHTDIICYVMAVITQAMGGGLITMPLPMMVFFWGTLSNPRPSKFFWVSMIAYTELAVVVKFICQFGFFQWNTASSQNENANEPLSVGKLFGVLKTDYFAFYEVALLMALFFHRYMLRKFGLWKDANVSETFDIDSIRESGAGDDSTQEDPTHEDPTQEDPTEEDPTQESTSKKRTGTMSSKKDDEDNDSQNAKKGPISRFISQLFHPKFRYIRDLYPAMFAMDMLAFLIVTFGYSSFGEGGTGNIINDVKGNRVPLMLVALLIGLSFMIVIDRGLYLRKAVIAKLIYQFVTVLFLHAWVFFALPSVTKIEAYKNRIAQALYIVKSIYLLMSAWQIRNGYPQLCIGNLLMHSYGLLNMVFYKIFMAVPFVWELRTTIDWTWTDTSMPLFDFFNMEYLYSTIYNLKCARNFETAYPAPRGEKKGAIVKYTMGPTIIILIVLLLWLPLLAFSLLNRIGEIQPPEKVVLTVAIEGYPPLYSVEAQGIELQKYRPEWLENMKKGFAQMFNSSQANSLVAARSASAFVSEYTENDIYLVKFRPESQTTWDISEESREALIATLKMNQNKTEQDQTKLKINTNMEVTRYQMNPAKDPLKHSHEKSIDVTSSMTDRLLAMLNHSQTTNVWLLDSLSLFYIVPNEGQISVAKVLIDSIVQAYAQGLGITASTLGGVNLRYRENPPLWTAQMRLTENGTKKYYESVIMPSENVTYHHYTPDLAYVQTTLFVDRIFPSLFTDFVKGGIIAMYIALVLVVGRVMRGLLANDPQKIMITEIPNADYLLKICLDIYLVREAKDFVLEQDLFAKLIFLFRSPETLIKWTRPAKTKSD